MMQSLMSSRSARSLLSPTNIRRVRPILLFIIIGSENEAKKGKEPQKDLLPEDAAKEAHFAPLKKRSTRIMQLADDIIAHQNDEREKEALYKQHLENLNSGFKFITLLQVGILVGAGVFSVIALRKFFVKKHIY